MSIFYFGNISLGHVCRPSRVSQALHILTAGILEGRVDLGIVVVGKDGESIYCFANTFFLTPNEKTYLCQINTCLGHLHLLLLVNTL